MEISTEDSSKKVQGLDWEPTIQGEVSKYIKDNGRMTKETEKEPHTLAMEPFVMRVTGKKTSTKDMELSLMSKDSRYT